MSRHDTRDALNAASQLNLLERVIAQISPEAAARRMRARMFMAAAGSYTGGSRSRRQTSEWKYPKGNSADADVIFDMPALRDRSRDLVRNEPLAAGAIAGTVTSVVGTGLALHPKVDADVLGLSDEEASALNKLISQEFCLWADGTACDATRTQDFYALQGLVFRSALESGDVFALTPMREISGMPYRTCLQILEADQCSNEQHALDTIQCAGGVQMDALRAPVAYWFQEQHPGSINRVVSKWHSVEAFGAKTGRRQVIHLYDKLRPGQTRGVPWLTPVIETLKMLGKYTEAELMAAVVAGMFTVFVESDRGGLDPAGSGGLAGETGAASTDKDIKLGSGAIVDLVPGEKVSFANPGRPNQAFTGFVDALAGFIGLALELPKEVLLKQFLASYSASRAALLEAWKFYRKRRVWLAAMFCQPAYEVWFDEAVALGRIAAPGYFDDALMRRAYLNADWIGDGPISIDPVKDIEAATGRIELGISTRQKEAAAYDGGDWEQNNVQLGKEEAARKKAGLVPTAALKGPGARPGTQNPEDVNQGGSDLQKPENT